MSPDLSQEVPKRIGRLGKLAYTTCGGPEIPGPPVRALLAKASVSGEAKRRL